MIRNSNQRGFTLIELLVVIGIIGVLATIVLGAVNSAREEANDSRRISDIRQMQRALELAFDENGEYPTSAWTCSHQAGWQSGVLATALEPYLSTLPVDPINETTGNGYNGYHNYCYYSRNYPSGTPNGSGKWYMLVFKLERADVILDQNTGVTACDGSQFPYGGAEDGILIDVGGDCYNFNLFN